MAKLATHMTTRRVHRLMVLIGKLEALQNEDVSNHAKDRLGAAKTILMALLREVEQR